MSWEQLLAILHEQVEDVDQERSRRPSACPNDGTPLETAPDGSLHCPFDGWRWA